MKTPCNALRTDTMAENTFSSKVVGNNESIIWNIQVIPVIVNNFT